MFIILVIGDKSDILPNFINLTKILSTPCCFFSIKFVNDFRYKCFIRWFEFKTIFYKIFIFNVLQAGMVIFIESIIFVDVLGYIYEIFV